MGGALLQIVAYGAQDIYLTGNPQITFFKMVYKRHTNFAIETHQVEFDGEADFGKRVVCNIGRNGDLLYNCFIVVYLPEITKKFLLESDTDYVTGIDYYYCNDENKVKNSKINKKFLNQHEIISWVNSIGHVIIDYVSIEIGGQEIDKHYGEWLEIWNELTIDSNKKHGFNNRMIGKYSDDEWFNKGIYYNANALRLYIPLQFWFCKNSGLALPLVALQYHDVKFIVKFNDFDNCWYNVHFNKKRNNPINPPDSNKYKMVSAYMECNYVYLDTDERKKFAQTSHEYLIDQLQFNDPITFCPNVKEISIDLNFNHPIKEMIWVCQKLDRTYNNDWFNFSAEERIQILEYDDSPQPNNTDALYFKFNNNDTGDFYKGPGKNNKYLFLSGRCRNTTSSSRQGQLTEIKKNILNNMQYFGDGYNYQENVSPLESAVIQLNGMDRFNTAGHKIFDTIQPYLHHTNIPIKGNIFLYSFCLEPEKMVPTGSCNFSRIDNATMNIKLNSVCFNNSSDNNFVDVRLYAVNYNILRIMGGMGGVAYSN